MVELMEVPKEITFTTGEQYQIEEITEDFFRNTAEYILNIGVNYLLSDLEIKSSELAYSPLAVTNDRLTYLILQGKYVVAGVLDIRTESNNCHYTFFRDLSFLK
jgi:hypothetical protein